MDFGIVITFFVTSVILTLSPGPDILYVISQSFYKGKKTGILISLGLTTGLLLHTLLVVLGLSFLIRENEFIFYLLKLIGASYFIYLAIVVYRKRKNRTENDVYESENNNFFKKGLIMNLVNPKVSLFFIALFPNFIFHDTLNSEIQFFILGLIFWFQANLIFIGFSLFSSKIKDFLSHYNLLINKRYLIEISVYVFFSIWILE